MSLVGLGNIGAAVGTQKITKVRIKVDNYTTIYDGVNKFTGSVPVGRNWELHIDTEVNNSTALWAAAIMVTATGVPSAYANQGNSVKIEFSGLARPIFGFNMGSMPNSNVTISIKLWTTDNWTETLPS